MFHHAIRLLVIAVSFSFQHNPLVGVDSPCLPVPNKRACAIWTTNDFHMVFSDRHLHASARRGDGSLHPLKRPEMRFDDVARMAAGRRAHSQERCIRESCRSQMHGDSRFMQTDSPSAARSSSSRRGPASSTLCNSYATGRIPARRRCCCPRARSASAIPPPRA